MKTGLFSSARRDLSLEDFLDFAGGLGVEMVEIGCGEEVGTGQCNPDHLMRHAQAYDSFIEALRRNNLEVSALSCHGNPISPDKGQAELSDRLMRGAVLLAKKMGLDTIVCFSGCPGGDENSKYLNWVTVSWPMDYPEAYKWQWDEVLVPYWKRFAAFAGEHGIRHIAIELHPGQMCFNPSTVKRLRSDVGSDLIGVNLDFSHLIWQRMDPILVIRELKGMIFHMHAKDIAIDEQRVRESGLIARAYFDRPAGRPWNFRIPGCGHGLFYRRNTFAELRRARYVRACMLSGGAHSPLAWR